MGTVLRLALLNANTTAAMTDRMVASASAMLGGRAVVEGVTAPFGAPYISDRAASAAAAAAVVEMGRTLAGREALSDLPVPDVAVIACFGDPGLWALREVLPRPVVGMAEASMLTACQRGRRFAIVTGGAAWKPMLEEFVALTGLAGRCAGIRTVPWTGDRIAADPDGAVGMLAGMARDSAGDGADVVILGGAGLVGLKPAVAAASGVPVLCSLECAVAQAVALSLDLTPEGRP